MDTELFKKIINSEESPVLDFKKEHYKLIGGTENDVAKFVKDIISFANTIRENTAYIIIGIEEKDGKKEFHGISDPIDDNILQSKIKDKVHPRPHFVYSNIEFENKIFGIIEIPLRRYAEPIMPIINMKSIEIGKVYYRHGTTNNEAKGRETIEIYNWITNLREYIEDAQIIEGITNLIGKISLNQEPLSVAISEGLKIAKKINDDELLTFCKCEIEGYFNENMNVEVLKHRVGKVIMSHLKINSVQVQKGMGINAFWNDLKAKKDFYEREIAFNEGILLIESYLEEYKKNGIDYFFTQNCDSSEVLGNDKFKGIPIYLYSGFYTHNALYQSIKKKYVELLLSKI